jgi:hypothetical protein
MDKKNGASPQPELDPDIAELLDIETEAPPSAPPSPAPRGAPAPAAGSEEGPDFRTLFAEEKSEAKKGEVPLDHSKRKFEPITRIEEESKPYFRDKDFYKKALAGEEEVGPRVHDLLGKYMKAQEPDEKSKFRAQLISAFWDLGTSISARAAGELIMPKRLLLRFGVLSPGFLSPEVSDMVCRVVHENKTGEPVFYLDEWLESIARGKIRPSTADEVKPKAKEGGQKISELVEKKKGQRDSELTILRGRIAQLDEKEAQLREQVEQLLRHETSEDFGGLKAPFTPAQKTAQAQIGEILRQLSSLDGQIGTSYGDLANISEELESLARKSEGVAAEGAVDAKTVVNEFASVRQMAKMCVGRQGNHFPILLAQYVKPNIQEIATRENVINEMAQIEALDPGLFLRSYKSQTTRIVPNVLLIASYGDMGICWEPFEKFNRSTSRGRIAIPMYPKNLRLAVLYALADLRWQVAKEKASYYWMEEGLTGKYYHWFSERKFRGDVREYFIRDYILWIDKESQGMQKLDKDVRGIFWRMMPFPQELKDSLRNRGFVYNELFKKDQNIARSDGY